MTAILNVFDFLLSSVGIVLLLVIGILVVLACAALAVLFGIHIAMPTVQEVLHLLQKKISSDPTGPAN